MSVAERSSEGGSLRVIVLSSVTTRASGLRDRIGALGFEGNLVEEEDLTNDFLGGEGTVAPSFWQMDLDTSGSRGA